jgi:hypothetical protein
LIVLLITFDLKEKVTMAQFRARVWRAGEGNSFHGKITSNGIPGECMATCGARRTGPNGVQSQDPDLKVFANEAQARTWIEAIAWSRGFSEYYEGP